MIYSYDLSFLDINEYALCSLIAKEVFGKEYLPEPNIDWYSVYQESVAQAVTIPVFLHCNDYPMEDNLKKKICNAVNERIKKCAVNYEHHTYLHNLMTKHKISYCILKGAVSASYYPESLTRQMGDVDFFVAKEDMSKVTEILLKDKFSKNKENHICHIVFKKDIMHFEAHFDPAGIPKGTAGVRIRELFEDMLEHIERIEEEPFVFCVPKAFYHGLILLLHMQHHLLAEGIGLRHLVDWAVFINNFSDEEFIGLFEEKLKYVGLWRFAQIISITSEIAFGITHQKWMGKTYEVGKQLLMDIMTGGNFGIKDDQRVYQGMFISNRGKDGVSSNRLIQMIRSFNQIVYTHWPISKSFKIILPFGWLYFSGRRLLRILKGTRDKINLSEAYKNSSGRKKLYKELHLFEI